MSEPETENTSGPFSTRFFDRLRHSSVIARVTEQLHVYVLRQILLSECQHTGLRKIFFVNFGGHLSEVLQISRIQTATKQLQPSVPQTQGLLSRKQETPRLLPVSVRKRVPI